MKPLGKPSVPEPARRVTYIDTPAHMRTTQGFTPKTAWIAHVKESDGLEVRRTHNRASSRLVPCPTDRRAAIEEALRHFGVL